MPGRHNRREPRNTTAAKRGALAAGVGVAGLAALAAAPLVDGSPVGAATVPSATVTVTDSPVTDSPGTTEAQTTTTTSSAPETSTTTSTSSAPETSTTTTTSTSSEPETSTTTTTSGPASESTRPTTNSAVPEYGLQKFRVGVERDPDPAREIPGSINTVTSKAHVVETGPGGDVLREFDCITEDGTPDDAADTTFCPGEQISLRQARGTGARGHLDPTPGFALDNYYASPGSTVTVTQTKVVDGLAIDSQTLTLPPCDSLFGRCIDGEGEGASLKSTDMIFTDTALPPTAVDDKATTAPGTPAAIDVAANDHSYGTDDTYSVAVTGVEIDSEPTNGTAVVSGTGTELKAMKVAAGAPTITYTPKAGFAGVDTFRYRLLTRNGASTATVTVTVPGGSTTTPDAPDTTEPGSLDVDPVFETRTPDGTDNDDDLAATGAESAPLVGYGLALLGAGAGAVAVGRHRQGGRRSGRYGGRRQRRAH